MIIATVSIRLRLFIFGIYRTEEDTCTDPEQPPQYDTAYLLNESPPVYQDALQDVVIAKGEYNLPVHV